MRSIKSKSDQVQHLLNDSNLDFLCLSETWLHKYSPSAVFSAPGYNIYRRDRLGSKVGGVLIYAKDIFNCKEIHVSNQNGLELICLDIPLSPQMSFVLIVIYRPPLSNIDFYEKLDNLLKQCNFQKEVIIMGDLNINWEDKQNRKNLKRVMDGMDLTLLIHGPTKMTNSTSTHIDLVFSNRPERILKSFNMLTGLSDHNLIVVARKLNSKRFKPLAASESHTIPRNEQHNFKTSIQQVNWNELLSGSNLEQDCLTFSNKLQEIINNLHARLKIGSKRTVSLG